MGFFDDPANQPPGAPAAPSNASSYGGGSKALGDYLGPGGTLLDPWTEQFQAPSAEQAINSPGLQYALGENNRMLQAGAASKGTLLTGRFQQALGQANIGQALAGYGDVYNRSLGQYLTGRENFQSNQDRPYQKLTGLAQLGKPNA